jgi:hypothetical protein
MAENAQSGQNVELITSSSHNDGTSEHNKWRLPTSIYQALVVFHEIYIYTCKKGVREPECHYAERRLLNPLPSHLLHTVMHHSPAYFLIFPSSFVILFT